MQMLIRDINLDDVTGYNKWVRGHPLPPQRTTMWIAALMAHKPGTPLIRRAIRLTCCVRYPHNRPVSLWRWATVGDGGSTTQRHRASVRLWLCVRIRRGCRCRDRHWSATRHKMGSVISDQLDVLAPPQPGPPRPQANQSHQVGLLVRSLLRVICSGHTNNTRPADCFVSFPRTSFLFFYSNRKLFRELYWSSQ